MLRHQCKCKLRGYYGWLLLRETFLSGTHLYLLFFFLVVSPLHLLAAPSSLAIFLQVPILFVSSAIFSRVGLLLLRRAF